MVLTFTLSLAATKAGRPMCGPCSSGCRGCNLTWAIIDACMYLMDTRGERLLVDATVVESEPGTHRWRAALDGTGWELDELIRVERFLALNVAGKGLVVLTACSRAGVINVLKHVQACFPGKPLHAVIDGLHLSA
jgi:hypothetical protein